MKILFFYIGNTRSVFILSLAERLKQRNIEVFFLFLCAKGELQTELESYGIACFNYESGKKGLVGQVLKNTLFLIHFARQHKPNCIFSHLNIPNLCAATASYFLPKTRVVACRHHADEFYQSGNKNGILLDKIINRLSKTMVVVSQKAYNHLAEVEKIPTWKLKFLPLAYDFEKYKIKPFKTPKEERDNQDLSVIFISRLIKDKRIEGFFSVIQYFKNKGIRIKAVIAGEGPFEGELKKQVEEYDISECVFLKGFQKQNDLIPLIQDADLLVHLSVSESSNQVLKEAGYCGKTVIACKGVGDFDTYLDDSNAYLVEKNFTTAELIKVVEKILQSPQERLAKGLNLRNRIVERFTLNDKRFNQYLAVLGV
jgi:glycosyltransferase involved in cell wall biosynthesis